MVVALSGRTAAGKSSVSEVLSGNTGWPVASFGGFVRAEAEDRGLSSDRDTLQGLGESLISGLGWKEFCLAVLASCGIDPPAAPCIVEGIRHADAVACLRDLFAPDPVVHVHLDVSDDVRTARLAEKGVSVAEGEAWETHPTESEVLDGLPSAADLIVQIDTASPEGAASSIECWLSEQPREECSGG